GRSSKTIRVAGPSGKVSGDPASCCKGRAAVRRNNGSGYTGARNWSYAERGGRTSRTTRPPCAGVYRRSHYGPEHAVSTRGGRKRHTQECGKGNDSEES